VSFDYDWWESLSPEEQDELLASLATEEDPFNFSYGGVDPAGEMVQPDVSMFETKGDIDPLSRTEEAGRVNLLQDYGALSVDNILSGYAGGGGYDTDAFTPTYDYGDPLNMSGRRKAEGLAGSGGWQGFVSNLILNGMSPAEAEQELYETVTAPDDETLSEDDRAMKESLVASMPPNMSNEIRIGSGIGGGGDAANARSAWDTETVNQFTTRVWADLMEDPDYAYQDPTSGQYFAKTPEQAMVKTPQMEKFDAFGLPYPTASYEDQDYIDQMTQLQSGMEPERLAQAGSDWEAMQKRLNEETATAFEGDRLARGSARDLERAFAEAQADTRPMTEFDAQLEALRKGEDPTRASEQYEKRYGMNTPSFAEPNAELDRIFNGNHLPQRDDFLEAAMARIPEQQPGQGWSTSEGSKDREASMEAARVAADLDFDKAMEDYYAEERDRVRKEAGYDPATGKRDTFDFATATFPGDEKPPMIAAATPWTTIDRNGNRVIFDTKGDNPTVTGRKERRETGPFKGVFDFLGEPLNDQGRLERLTERQVKNQRGRTQESRRERDRAQRAAYQATFRDPRLAQVEAMGRAWAMAQAGQTPFRDAMSARNTNARRMLGGG
jgi:hypothetical protein